jgi:hypothetical protein
VKRTPAVGRALGGLVLTFLALVSVLAARPAEATASTVSPATGTAAPLAAWSSATVPLASNGLAHDAARDVLLSSVPSSHATLGNSLVELDPETGALDRHVYVGSEPGQVALTDDGSTAYVALDGANGIAEVDLATFTLVRTISTGVDPVGGPLLVEDLATLPGRSDIVVASLRKLSTVPAHAGVAAFVDGVRLAGVTADHSGSDRIAAISGDRLYGYSSQSSWFRNFLLVVDDGGVTETGGEDLGGPIEGFDVDIEVANGRAYSTAGTIVDVDTFEAVGSFGGSGLIEVTPDDRITVLSPLTDAVSVFDATTGALLGSRSFAPLPDVHTLVATASGFAAAGPSGVVLLGPAAVGGAFVAPAPPTGSLTGMSQTVFPWRVNDLLFDESRGLVYASVGGVAGERAGELVAVRPSTGQIERSVLLGSDPGPISMSDDGSTLYVGLSMTGRVAEVDLSTFQTPGSFSLGADGFGTLVAEDLEVRAGTTDHVVVSLMSANRHRAVALFVDGVRAPASSPSIAAANRIEAADGEVFYGIETDSTGFSLSQLRVTAGGVELLARHPKMSTGFDTDVTLFDDRLYSTSRRIFDPSVPALIGMLPAAGPIAADRDDSRLYLADRDGGDLLELDRSTLRVVSVLDGAALEGTREIVSTRTSGAATPSFAASVRWGSGGRLVLLGVTPGRFHSVAPARLADTRSGQGVRAGRLTAGSTIEVDVTGRAGLPSTGVGGVVVNLTVVGATTAGYLTAWSTGAGQPSTSNLNFRAGQVVANQAVVPVGVDGSISIANSAGATHVVVDVQGWFGDGSEQGGTRFQALPPARLGDTRTGVGLPLGRIGPGQGAELEVAGIVGLPEEGVAAVVVNVTAVGALAPTHLTLWASGGAKPATSNVNVAAGQVVANQAIVPVGPSGRISIANAAGATHVIVDVQGWFADTGALLHTTGPTRLADSRLGVGVPAGKVPAGGTVVVDVTGVGGLPATGVVAVVVNLTVTGATASSHLTAWPTGQPKPSTSNVNFGAGQVVANQAIIPVGADGTISIANAAGATHVIVDVQGWFGPAD